MKSPTPLLPILGAATLPLASSLTIKHHPRQSQPIQLASVPSAENLAVRPEGMGILTTNMNSPDLTLVDTASGTTSVIHTVTGSAGLSGIRSISPDVYVAIGGTPQGTSVYKIDFTTQATPRSEKLADVPGASNMNGMTVLNEDVVLLADAGAGKVYSLTLSTGEIVTVAEDPTMAPTAAIPFGIDGILYVDGYIYYSNIFANSFHRMAVDPDTGMSTGQAETFWTNLMGDDLCLGPNGMIYLATNGGNSLVEVDPETGAQTSVASITGSTACEFGTTEEDMNVVYVTSGSGVFAVTIPME